MKKILGIDVGGTKIAAGLVDNKLRVSSIAIMPTSQTDLVRQLVNLVGSYDGFSAIGLAMPGQVLGNGVVTRLPNVKDFDSVNLKQTMAKKFKVPVNVLNDAKAFTFAEALVGQGKDSTVVAGIILGTGVGVGIVIYKKIYLGKDGIAGELEHVTLLDNKMFRDHRHAAGEFVNAHEAKKYLKTILNMVVLSFNPDVIVLGGSWSKLTGMEVLANTLTTSVGGYKNTTPVRISKLKHAGIIGVALPLLKK